MSMFSIFNDMNDSLMPIKSGDFGFFSIEFHNEDEDQVLLAEKETAAKAAEVAPTSSDINAVQRSQALIELLQGAIEQREMLVRELMAGRTASFQNGSMESLPPPPPQQQGVALHQRRHVDMTDLLPDKLIDKHDLLRDLPPDKVKSAMVDLRDAPPPPARTLPAACTRGPTGPTRQHAGMHTKALPSTARKGGVGPDEYEYEYEEYSHGDQGSSDLSDYYSYTYSSSAGDKYQDALDSGGLARLQRVAVQDPAPGSMLMAKAQAQQRAESRQAEEAFSYYPSYYAYYGDDGSSTPPGAAPAAVGSIFGPGPAHTANEPAVRSTLQRVPRNLHGASIGTRAAGPGAAPLPDAYKAACERSALPRDSDFSRVRDLPRSTLSPTSDEEIECVQYDYSSDGGSTPPKVQEDDEEEAHASDEYDEAYGDAYEKEAVVYDSYSYSPTSDPTNPPPPPRIPQEEVVSNRLAAASSFFAAAASSATNGNAPANDAGRKATDHEGSDPEGGSSYSYDEYSYDEYYSAGAAVSRSKAPPTRASEANGPSAHANLPPSVPAAVPAPAVPLTERVSLEAAKAALARARSVRQTSFQCDPDMSAPVEQAGQLPSGSGPALPGTQPTDSRKKKHA